MDLASWFFVSYDEELINLDVSPPNGNGWKVEIRWKDIIRICFKPGNLFFPDEIYIFTSLRPESYLIPLEAFGAPELWNEAIRKNLFPPSLAIKAASADEGIYCWPENEK